MPDTFSLGLVIGLLFGAPLFGSAQMATGLLLATSAEIALFAVTKGIGAFHTALGEFVTALGADYKLVMGLLAGLAIAGAYTSIFRNRPPSQLGSRQ